MKNDIKKVAFFNSVEKPLNKTGESLSAANFGYETMTLEVKGSGTISCNVQGTVNTVDDRGGALPDDKCLWTNVQMFSSNFSPIDSITTEGLYYVVIIGLSRIRVKVSAIEGEFQLVGCMEE